MYIQAENTRLVNNQQQKEREIQLKDTQLQQKDEVLQAKDTELQRAQEQIHHLQVVSFSTSYFSNLQLLVHCV